MILQSSYPDLVIPNVSFADYILPNLFKHPGAKPALISAGSHITYSKLLEAIFHCKSFLLQKGLKKNDVIALCCPNIPNFVVCLIATSALGGIVTTCNPHSTSYELVQQFKDSKPKLVFTILKYSEKFKAVCKAFDSIQDVVFFDGGNDFISFGNTDIPKKFAQIKNVNINPKHDILLLPYSSGTTGMPKGVMLSHYNLTSSLIISKINWNLSLKDVEYLVVPLFHIYGLLRCFSALNQGATLVFEERFNLNRMGNAIQTYKVTSLPIVPPILLSISKSDVERKYDLSSLRIITIGAAPIAPDLLLSVARKLDCFFLLAWGMTETTGVSVIMNHKAMGISPKSSGTVCPMNLIKVIDVESGKELGPNQSGEIMVKGPDVMIGYYNRPEATAKVFDEDGFLHTGDVGYYNEQEEIFVVDRLKELIKYKGFQVAPAEIEHVLMSHTKIRDAAVIGVPDKQAGEKAKAFIVKKDDSLTFEDVHDFLNNNLSKYKQLHGGIEFVDHIPKSPSGKILRRLLREASNLKSNL